LGTELLTGPPPLEENGRLMEVIGVVGAGEEDLVETDELLPE